MTNAFVLLLIASATAVLVFAAGRDVATRRIPNRLPAVLVLLGAALQLHAGQLGLALAAAAAVFGGLYAVWLLGWIGGADVKLLAAAALLVPPDRVGALLLAVSLAGGVLAAAYLLLARLRPRPPVGPRGHARGTLDRVLRAEARRIRRGGPLPYAVAIGAGALITLYEGWA